MSSARSSTDQLSHDCIAEFETLKSSNNQIQEELSNISTDIKKTGQSLMDVEKSVTSLTEKGEFIRPARIAKEITSDVEYTTNTDNKFAELDDESDDEVIFKGSESKSYSFKSVGTQATEKLPERDTQDKSDNQIKNNKEKIVNAETADKSDNRKTFTRKEMVYLVGDSITGQVNQAMLGKATQTFVKKLKASKIEDLHALSHQVKDAKIIIINTGINNIREKDPTAERVKGLIESVTSLREAAPESKIVVSKVIPIGDHEVDIERNLFNVESEKKLTEINKTEINFIDHGNLAERGAPIKKYYRPDFGTLSWRRCLSVCSEPGEGDNTGPEENGTTRQNTSF